MQVVGEDRSGSLIGARNAVVVSWVERPRVASYDFGCIPCADRGVHRTSTSSVCCVCSHREVHRTSTGRIRCTRSCRGVHRASTSSVRYTCTCRGVHRTGSGGILRCASTGVEYWVPALAAVAAPVATTTVGFGSLPCESHLSSGVVREYIEPAPAVVRYTCSCRGVWRGSPAIGHVNALTGELGL